MKEIESKDLVIGQEYYDIPTLNLDFSTVLRVEKMDKEAVYLSYVRGAKSYEDEPLLKFRMKFDFKWYQP